MKSSVAIKIVAEDKGAPFLEAKKQPLLHRILSKNEQKPVSCIVNIAEKAGKNLMAH